MTYSRSGIGSALIACYFFYLFQKNKRITFARILTSGFALFLFALILYFLYLFALDFISANLVDQSSNSFLTDKEGSFGVRLEVFSPLLNVINSYPLLGIGFGNIKAVLLKDLGYEMTAHNMFLGVVTQFGIPSLLMLLATIFSSFYCLFMAINKFQKEMKPYL